MSETDARLRGCFALAFPDLDPGEVTAAAVDTVADWDSLHAVVLVALIEEAFSLRIPARDYPGWRSYAAIEAYLCRSSGDAE